MPFYKYRRDDKRIEQKEIDTMLSKTERQQIKALVSIAYLSGARISEIILLRPKDVNIKDKDIAIRLTTLKRSKYIVKCLKCRSGSKTRLSKYKDKWLRICGKCGHKKEVDILKEKELRSRKTKPYTETRILTFKRNNKYVKLFENYVIATLKLELDDEVKLFTLSRQLANYYLKNLNENVSPHAFRHSRFQKLADHGATAIQLKAFGGWKKMETVMKYVEASKLQTEPLKEMIE